MAAETISEMMESYAEDGRQFAADLYDINLNWSPASLELVEDLLDRMHDELPRPRLLRFVLGPSSDLLKNMALILGGYVGEVLRRSNGGEWHKEPHSGGIGLCGDAHWHFPIQQCHSWILRGQRADLRKPLAPSELRP